MAFHCGPLWTLFQWLDFTDCFHIVVEKPSEPLDCMRTMRIIWGCSGLHTMQSGYLNHFFTSNSSRSKVRLWNMSRYFSAPYGWNNIQKPLFSQFLNFEEDQKWQTYDNKIWQLIILKDRLGGNWKKQKLKIQIGIY